MTRSSAQPLQVRVVRDGVVESLHSVAVAVADASGALLAEMGDVRRPIYVRSAAKPFQALATLEALDSAGVELGSQSIATASASHRGSSTQQIEAAFLLALAALDEQALRCPPALPGDVATLVDQRTPTRLAHNCSGKHGGFLLATVARGGDPATYLDVDNVVQLRVREHLAAATGADPEGPGVDGCGAPAWRLPLSALATGFARLAAGSHGLARVAAAIRAHPDLVGGGDCDDTALMRADSRVVAKRGAEAVLAAGVSGSRPVAVAVKVLDGGVRAAGPAVAAVLAGLGIDVPDAVARPPVLGGGRPHGVVEVDARSLAALAD